MILDLGAGGGTKNIPPFTRLGLLVTVGSVLRRACDDNHGSWVMLTLRKVAITGGGGWVDSSFEHRHAFYNLKQVPDNAGERLAQRHAYMAAKAVIEVAIAPAVFTEMLRQQYDPVTWDGVKRDLCVLLVVVQNFMSIVSKQEPLKVREVNPRTMMARAG